MVEMHVSVVPRRGPDGRLKDLGGKAALPENFEDRADELAGALEEVARLLGSRLPSLEKSPPSDWRLNEVSLSFSLDLEVETGVIIAKSKAAAGFETTIKWGRGNNA